MLRYGIPDYRLPQSVVERTVALLEAAGVEFRCGVALGATLTVEDLRADFDRVFVATGAWGLPRIGLEREDELLAGLDFLTAVAAGDRRVPGPRLLVIGGGSVAMDVAVTARRLGAERVTVACLETCDEMPALLEEVEEALAEGIELTPSCGPSRVLRRDGRIVGMELVNCTSVFDEQACFAPTFDESARSTIDADEVILAVGQRVEAEVLRDAGLVLDGGRLVTDPESQRTAADGVFAGGDVATGPATVIAAIGAGRRAAATIDAELAGAARETPRSAPGRTLQTFDPASATPSPRRGGEPVAPPARSLCDEDCCTVSSPIAVHEAARCFNCGCVAVTPSDLAPVLVALDATVVTTAREISAADFFVASSTASTVLHRGELVSEVRLPPPPSDMRSAYVKFRLRNAIDFPILSVAAVLVVGDGRVTEARIVLGAAAPIPLRASFIEHALEGLEASPVDLSAAAKAAASEWAAGCLPLEPNAYKLTIVPALVARAVDGAARA